MLNYFNMPSANLFGRWSWLPDGNEDRWCGQWHEYQRCDNRVPSSWTWEWVAYCIYSPLCRHETCRAVASRVVLVENNVCWDGKMKCVEGKKNGDRQFMTNLMCFKRCMNLCLWRWVRKRGFWAASGSKLFMLTSPSSGRTVSTHNRQMESSQLVTNIFATLPLHKIFSSHVKFKMLYIYGMICYLGIYFDVLRHSIETTGHGWAKYSKA